MSLTLFDSKIYEGAWSSAEMRELLLEDRRIAGWLYLMRTLAECQAEMGLLSSTQAAEIVRVAHFEKINFEKVRESYDHNGHSLQGLIEAMRSQAQAGADDFYLGLTVQDLTDTWTALVLREAWCRLYSDLIDIHQTLLALTGKYRRTPMAGRTHGQLGSPITFGFKCAVWAVEIQRHLDRWHEILPRLTYGQLSGAVGSAAGFGGRALELQEVFFGKLNLKVPTVSWTSSRDVQSEFTQLLALTAATFAKIGNEIYNLQRTEIGEVSEGGLSNKIGSITMPQKRNPEIAEHLGTLWRSLRARAGVLSEAVNGEHERDGASWKSEWLELPECLLLASASFSKAKTMLAALEVHEHTMKVNLERSRGLICADALMSKVAEKIGARGRAKVTAICAESLAQGARLRDLFLADAELVKTVSPAELDQIFSYEGPLASCEQFAARAIAAGQARAEADLNLLRTVRAKCPPPK